MKYHRSELNQNARLSNVLLFSLYISLVSALKPIIAAIKAHPQLALYALPIQRVAVVRVMQQLSRVYRYLPRLFLLSFYTTNCLYSQVLMCVATLTLYLTIFLFCTTSRLFFITSPLIPFFSPPPLHLIQFFLSSHPFSLFL